MALYDQLQQAKQTEAKMFSGLTVYTVKMRLIDFPEISLELTLPGAENVLDAEQQARAYAATQDHPKLPGQKLPRLGWLIKHTYSD